MQRVVLLDGNSLAHRAFHAIPALSTREGLPTNAVYGFTGMLLKLLKEIAPDSVVAAFDKGRLTFRHAVAASYKAHRPATPEDLRPQFPLIKEVLQAFRIPVLENEGFEADDIIGTLVTQAEKAGYFCFIVTGDLDTLQLVSPQTTVLTTRKGISEIVPYDEKAVVERYGVTPQQLPDLKGLTGDASDNIPGVPGIGPKTAAALLRKYGSLEEIFNHLPELPANTRSKLLPYKDQALLSKQLATIQRAVPLATDITAFTWPGPDMDKVYRVFQRLEFRSLLKKLPEIRGQRTQKETPGAALPAATEIAFDPAAPEALLEKLAERSVAALALRGNAQGSLACALCPDPETVFTAAGNASVAALLKVLLAFPELRLTVHDAKQVLHLLQPLGLGPEKVSFDTMIAAYLLNPAVPNTLDAVAFEHLGTVLPAQSGPPEQALAVFLLTPTLAAKLRLEGQDYLFREVELPLAAVLQAMEAAGIAVDRQELEKIAAELADQIREVTGEIFKLAGEEFNLNSPKQLGRILFEKLGLKPVRKTKTGYATDAAVLEKLSEHKIVARILQYRQLAKFKNTYADALLQLINPRTGRLHTTFYQTVTATGRLASAEPNLQNIPVRDPLGRRIRRAFVAGLPGSLLLSADYSQIELRILAHLAGDELLTAAFNQGEDIHTRTAAEVFGLAPEAVTPELRARAKVVNFGIIYGMSDYGLAQELKIEPGEAHRYIERYFARYVGVKRFIEKTIRQARETGFVTTVLGRRRYIPEILSPNRIQRQLGERLAVNTTIQGSAADLIKKAMVDIHRELTRGGYSARMVLQVHDELLFEVPAGELPTVAPLIKVKMEQALPFAVPITVTLKAGPNWHDLEKIEV